MASAGNPNQPGQFDMQKLFKPSSNPSSSSPNPNHPNPSSPFPPTPYPTPPSPSPSPSSSSSSSSSSTTTTTSTTTTSYLLPSGPFSYPPQTSPFHHHHNHLPYPPLRQQDQLQIPPPNVLLHQRPISSFTNPSVHPNSNSNSNPNPNPHSQLSSPNHSARLMALINSNAPSNNLELPQSITMPPPPPPPTASTSSEYLMSMNPSVPSAPPVSLSIPPPTPARMHSSKPPKGRHLTGDHVVYDVDIRFQGEVQPQLEVTPITKYVSDPGLVLGRQIAVNRTYICYGLKTGQIRVLNINTASRSLFRGLVQRVTDMAFFAEDVHLLASASIDGRVFVWKINEGLDGEHKPQITGQIIIAVQIVGEGESVYPRVCWYSHKQEVLVVGIGKCVLKIDTTKVGKGEKFSGEEPLKCHIDKLIDGVQFIGKHDDEVTDLSMCQWMTTRLVSASKDGTVKVWEDRKQIPLAVLRPHDGQPVSSVTFLTSPHRPDHIILITAGPLNREMKIWSSASQEGWLLPTDVESWQCTQTLELKSSAEPRFEEAFFNQVIALPRAGLILLANAKKNAIYAVHIEYGPYPSATRMDYIAEFTVTMPILSLTGTSDSLPDGNNIVQVYCVQTQAIQQYALDLSQCLPPPLQNIGLEKTDSNVSRAFETSTSDGFGDSEPGQGNQLPEMSAGSAAPKQTLLMSNPKSTATSRYPNISNASDITRSHELDTIMESRQILLPPASSITESIHTASPPRPLSPRLSGKLSGFRSPSNSFESGSSLIDRGVDQPVLDYSVDRGVDTVPTIMPDAPTLDDNSMMVGNKILQNEISMVNSPTVFKPPTHLITPSEILSRAVSSSDSTQFSQGIKAGEAKIQDVVVDNGVENVEVEVKVVGEVTGLDQCDEVGHHGEPYAPVTEKKEKSFFSQASNLSVEMARECCSLSTETYSVETRQPNDARVTEVSNRTSSAVEKQVNNSSKDMPENVSEMATPASAPQSTPAAKGKKQKTKNPQVPGPSSPSPSPFNSADSSNEPGSSSTAVQKTLNQLLAMQNEMQKQMIANMASPAKEGKRLEASLGKSIEKTVKLNNDALWARFQEERAKNEKSERDRIQQITSVITNCMSKDLPAMLDRTLKKELASVGQSVARIVTPSVEKSISSVTESFQRGVGDKAVNQLEKSVYSKLEATVVKQIQAQFQTSGKQAIQDSLRSCFEATVVPAFEMSCKSIFEQVDAAFQKGMVEHTTAALQQFDFSQSPLALALRETINSASSITQTLTGELADGQRKFLALAAAGANSKAVNPLVTQISNGPLAVLQEMVEVPLDPTKELSRLISDRKIEEAFTAALQRSDVSIVSWLCSQVDLAGILSATPLPLSQGVLLALLQQLACGINKEMSHKLTWMTEVACVINPADPMIAMHARPIFEQVYQILGHHRTLPTTSAAEGNSIRIVMHVINSMLTSCK